MQKIQPALNEDIELPLATEDGGILTSRGFLTGTSGGGKSNTTGVICEQILEKGQLLMVIDTEGEYYALKEDYEILHAGATEECDFIVDESHAEKIAELALEQNVPIVLDVSEYIEEEEVLNLIETVLEALFRKGKKLKKPFPVFIEEAHNYIPQQGSTSASKIIKKFAKQGRKRGLGLIAISQRPAEVDKAVITQSDWRVWHGFEWDNDLDVAGSVLGSVELDEENKEELENVLDQELSLEQSVSYRDIVAELEVGQAVLECNFIDISRPIVKFKRKNTFDAGATPTLDDTEKPVLKSIDGDLLDELQKISEKKEKERNKIEQLEEEIEKREQKIEELQDEVDAAKKNNQTVNKLADQLANIAGGGEGSGQEALENIREEKDKRIQELEKELSKMEKEKKEAEQQLEEYEKELEKLEEFREYKDMAAQLEDKKEMAEEAIERLAKVFDIDVNGSSEKVKKQLKQKEKKVKDLQKQVRELQSGDKASEDKGIFEDAAEFLENDVVKEQVGKAADNSSINEEHYWDVLTVVAYEQNVQQADVVPVVDVSKSSVGRILAKLKDHKVLKKERDGKQHLYSLNTESISDIIDLRDRRERMRKQSEKFKPGE